MKVNKTAQRKLKPFETLQKDLDKIRVEVSIMTPTTETGKEAVKTFKSIADSFDELLLTRDEKYAKIKDDGTYGEVESFMKWSSNVFNKDITSLKASLKTVKEKLGI